jgi:hypothetical protein
MHEERLMYRLVVDVTQEDIDNGNLPVSRITYNRPHCCPIAQSLKRRGFEDVHVGSFVDFFYEEPQRYMLSPRAEVFIEKFDSGSKVEPSRFIFKRM